MNELLSAIETGNNLYVLIGFFSTAVAAILLFFAIAWKGLFVWYRIGKGLAKRKIAIFADTEFEALKNLLVDSGIINSKNLLKIGRNEIGRAESCTLYLGTLQE